MFQKAGHSLLRVGYGNLLVQTTDPKALLLVDCSVADPDPGSGAFLTSGSGCEVGKKSRSGSGMNIQDHISELRNNFLG
jgi:hypothetical protein